jgi:hypothetical protein
VEAVLSRMVFSMPVAVTSTEPSLALSFTVTSVSPAAARGYFDVCGCTEPMC